MNEDLRVTINMREEGCCPALVAGLVAYREATRDRAEAFKRAVENHIRINNKGEEERLIEENKALRALLLLLL